MFEIEKELQEIREKKRVIPATFDPVFKSLLTNENNRGYLEDLISYVTKILKEIISKNMVVVNNQLPIEKYNNKQMNTDILVEIERNVINLEMNAQKEIGIFEKNAAYYQKLMVEQYKRSADYRNIKRVIQINFNDFKYFSDEDIIGLYDVKKAAEWGKNCTKAYFEELEKDIKKYEEDVKKHEKDVKKREENIRKQQQEIEKQKENIRKQEEETRKKELDQEKKQKLEMAKNLLKENIDIDIILKVTSLNKEDIKGLNF